ncbi:hypothetical protein ACJJI3_15065 [Microbulbifer sp. ZKSA004]|uniref:hypothetical protein n=1 Tax=Microbulbifer sp. ZKSA004 TaxID=3243389 RepID=UPI00403A64CB
MKKFLAATILLAFSANVFSAAWTAKITKIQAEGIGENYNVLYLDTDITNSMCENTNAQDRITIVNEAQHSTALAALMAGKIVQVMESGANCNEAGLANINYIMIYSDK